ncbi:MAG TPA: M50 family metallopeptidase [Miltoncostaeaceae bacterium]|nr:M50 family metallopeptidase [Miltoncostaeaceae bacterium]
MNLAWNLLQFVLIMMGLVLVHEAGHMVVAKWCGMRVEKFSIFFGRPLASFQRGETQYAIGWLPLGGYVKITGMTREEDVPADVSHRAYFAAPVWRRIATIAAGPGVNVVLAVLAFAIMFWIGVPRTVESTPTVAQVTAESPAATIGLQQGDQIVAVDGVRGELETLRERLSARPGEVVEVTYRRGEQEFTRSVRLRTEFVDGEAVGRLGLAFGFREGPPESSGLVGGVVDALDFSWFVTETTGRVIARQFTDPNLDEASSVVGAGAVYNEVADDGLTTVLRFIGLISLALALFNLLPLPPLDGGHILFALVEKVRGSPVPRRVYESVSIAGFVVILFVGLLLIQNDIFRISNGTLLP